MIFKIINTLDNIRQKNNKNNENTTQEKDIIHCGL
jgi:hypothetical protein